MTVASIQQRKPKPAAICANFGCGLPATKVLKLATRGSRVLCDNCYAKKVNSRKKGATAKCVT